MSRIRRSAVAAMLAAILAAPLPGCAGGPAGAGPMGAVAKLALSVGASVGSYLLIKEITE